MPIISTNPIDAIDVLSDTVRTKSFEDGVAIHCSPSSSECGGLTLRAVRDRRNDRRPRALVYWGPLPKGAEGHLRHLVKPLGILPSLHQRRHESPTFSLIHISLPSRLALNTDVIKSKPHQIESAAAEPIGTRSGTDGKAKIVTLLRRPF